MSQSKQRLLELNARLAQNLSDKGVAATADETTTDLINKVADIQNGDESFLFGLIERNLTEVTIPQGVTKIGSYAFYGASTLTDISIPDGVTSIGSNAFQNCTNLQNITIPDNVTSIGTYAFHSCKALAKMPVTKNMWQIENYCFHSCQSLTEVVLPENISKVGNQAFLACSGVKRLCFEGTQISAQSGYALRSFHFVNLEEVVFPQGFNGSGINLSDSTLLSRTVLVDMFEALADRTGQTANTLTIGASNIDKLTEEELAIATAKNWTIA